MNPNSKIPALLDRRTDPATRVFESGSILLYLAESFGAFLPTDHASRTEALNWLFWQMGAGPFLVPWIHEFHHEFRSCSGSAWTWIVRSPKRLTVSRIWSAVFVHTNGLPSSLWASM